jgi:hypothetical protein
MPCATVESAEVSRWPAALYEVGRSVLMLTKGSKIPRTELNTVHLYQYYSLFMPKKLQYNWHGDYCKCVRPAQLPVLTEVRAPSLLEQHPWYVPHRDRAGYNKGASIQLPFLHNISKVSILTFTLFCHCTSLQLKKSMVLNNTEPVIWNVNF